MRVKEGVVALLGRRPGNTSEGTAREASAVGQPSGSGVGSEHGANDSQVGDGIAPLPASPPLTREDIIRGHMRTDGICLEIGPSYNPILPKAAGYRVEVVDHTDKEGLVAKYRGETAIDWRRIEDVDHVVTGTLFDAIGKEGRYDTIVASNVAEHTPDLVAFLLDCQRLLKPGGQLVLVNPDKRYCFDVFRPVSTTGQVLQAHLDRRTRHSPGVMFDHVANLATRGGSAGWGSEDTAALALSHTAMTGMDHLNSVLASESYVDCHAWVFTPSSFRLIAKDLADVGLIELREQRFVPSVCWFEFLIVLSTEGEGSPDDRLTLVKRAIAEQGMIHVDEVS